MRNQLCVVVFSFIAQVSFFFAVFQKIASYTDDTWLVFSIKISECLSKSDKYFSYLPVPCHVNFALWLAYVMSMSGLFWPVSGLRSPCYNMGTHWVRCVGFLMVRYVEDKRDDASKYICISMK